LGRGRGVKAVTCLFDIKENNLALFKEVDGSLKTLKARAIEKERDLQAIVEKNLFEVLDMHFIASEYTTTFGGRIDTLAVDEYGCPVIIEYKKSKSDNVINQALSYLKWLRLQKIEFFEMLMQKTLPSEINKRIKLDWKNPRVICIAESYSKFDIDTVEVIPIRIELYRYKFYDDRIFSIDAVTVVEQNTSKSDPEPQLIPEASDLDSLLSKGSKEIQTVFGVLRGKILAIDKNIEERVTSLYIAFRLTKSFAEAHIGAKQIKIYLRPIDYPTKYLEVEKISDGYNWTLNRRIYLRSESEVDSAVKLIEVSLNDIV